MAVWVFKFPSEGFKFIHGRVPELFRMTNIRNGNNSEGMTVFGRNGSNMEGMTIIQKE